MASFITFKGDGDQPFRFRLNADGHTLSSEGYAATSGRDNGITSVRENSIIPARYEKRTSDNHKRYFVLKGGNHEVIGKSKLYDSDAKCDEGVSKVMAMAGDADVVEGEAK